MAYNEEDRYKHQAYQFLIGQVLRNRQAETSGIADLIRASEYNPEAGAQALSRYGINVKPGLSRRDASFRQALQLAAFRAATRGRSGGLPSDLIGAIGTPDFSQRLQSAAASGIDRQSLQTLVDLDRKEREFAAKGNKPGKLSPAATKLRELEALGIPITEDVVRSVYTPTAVVPMPADPTRRGRPVSLSALAGLTGAPAAEESAEPESEIEESAPTPPAGDRRSRLRSMLFGGGAEY